MAQTVLYYPTINIPDSQWLRQAVMYYDNVSSIVPKNLWNIYPISPEIRLLKDNGIFQEINPRDLMIQYEALHDFEGDLKAIIDSQEFQWALRSEQKMLDSRVHIEKVAIPIFNYLQKRELAREDPVRSDWYLFERKTALIFMSVLAAGLANIKDSTIPSTDNRTYHDLLFMKKKQSMGFKCSQLIFNHVLPVPKNTVPIEKILQFRNNHAIELINLRRNIDKFQKKVLSVESQADIVDIGVRYGEELKQNVLILGEDLKNEGISSFWHSLGAFLRDVKSTVSESLPYSIKLAVYGGAVGGPPGEIIAGTGYMGMGIAEKGIYLKAANIDARYRQRIQIRDHPFGYVYYGMKEGII